jgi:ribose transport system permease protein
MKTASEMGAAGQSLTRPQRLVLAVSRLWAWVFLALMVVFFVIAVPIVSNGAVNFFTVRNSQNILVAITPILLLGLGQTFVIIAGGIDLSVAALVTVAAVSLPLLSLGGDPTGVSGIVAVLAMTTLIGLANGLGVAFLRVHPMIMTLAMATFLQGLLIIVAGGSAVSLTAPVVKWLGNARPLGIPAGIGLWVIVAAGALYVLHMTPLGARILAVGANPLAARLAGVPVSATLCFVYALSGFSAGLAGVLLLGMNGQGYVGIGDPYVLASIAAVVLGGTSILGGSGSYAGTIPGATLLVTITALITVLNVSPGWRMILFGALILALLLLSGRETGRR